MTPDALPPIDLAVVDDHQAIVSAVISTLSAALLIRQSVTSSHAADLLAGTVDFDLVVLDVELNDGSSGPENVRALSARGWPVLLYTQETSTVRVGRCLQAGAAASSPRANRSMPSSVPPGWSQRARSTTIRRGRPPYAAMPR